MFSVEFPVELQQKFIETTIILSVSVPTRRRRRRRRLQPCIHFVPIDLQARELLSLALSYRSLRTSSYAEVSSSAIYVKRQYDAMPSAKFAMLS